MHQGSERCLEPQFFERFGQRNVPYGKPVRAERVGNCFFFVSEGVMTIVRLEGRHGENGRRVRFGMSEEAWDRFGPYLEKLVSRPGIKKVCEIGGGANPALPMELVES